MKILILAGGQGSRLQSYTNKLYPKLLLSLGNQTMLDKLVDWWFDEQGVDEMLIVLSEENYLNTVQKYLNTFHSDKNVKLCLYPKTDGTFRTIFYVLNKYPTYKSNTYLTWSDIIPKEKFIVHNEFNKDICIFTDENFVHRYSYNNQIHYTPTHNGNIMGLYYLNNIDPVKMINFYEIVSHDDNEIDFVDFLMECTNTKNKLFSIDSLQTSIYDIGDVPKYEKYLEEQSVDQRWFNDIQFKNGKVHKKAITKDGIRVMNGESNFYHYLKDNNLESQKSFPKIHNANTREIVMDDMTQLNYETVNQYLKSFNDYDAIEKMIYDFNHAIKQLNGNLKPSKFNNDIYCEYYQVPIERYNKIEYLIPKNINLVNGVKIPSFYEMMDKILMYLKKLNYQIGLIHGDTNTSNTMYNGNSICFIDPRGKFGNTLYFGDINYDHAKFLYGLTGYDNFNLDKNFKFEINDNEINFNIDGFDIDKISNNNHIKILVGLIWLKLPYYIKNNPNKVIASYFHGMYLLQKYLK